MPGKCSALARVESGDQLEALRSLLAGLCPTAPTMSDEWERCFASRAAQDGLRLRTSDAPDQSYCAVCYGSFEPGERVTELMCKHLYHKACVAPWLERLNACPVCPGRELRACCRLRAGRPDETSWRLRHAAAVSGRAAAAASGAAAAVGAAPVLPLSTVESPVVGPVREFMDGLGYGMTKEYVRRRLDFVKPPSSVGASGKLAAPVHVSHFEIFAMEEEGQPSSRDSRKPDAPLGTAPSEFGWLEVYAEVEDITNAADLAATREQVQQLAGLFSTTALKFNTLGTRSPELRIL
jgi:hypothetical protein